MCSLSDNQVVLLSLHVTGQLAQLLDSIVQSVRLRVVHVNVNHAVHVERHVQVNSGRLLVGETVLVSTGHISLHALVTVVNAGSGDSHLVVWSNDVEVNGVLFSIVGVSGTHLVAEGQLIVSLEVFEETLFAVWRQKNSVGLHHGHKHAHEGEEVHYGVLEGGLNLVIWKSCVFSSTRSVHDICSHFPPPTTGPNQARGLGGSVSFIPLRYAFIGLGLLLLLSSNTTLCLDVTGVLFMAVPEPYPIFVFLHSSLYAILKTVS